MTDLAGPEGAIACLPVRGVPEIRDGDDLAAILCRCADLRDGDVLVVTSKVVSKADGLVATRSKEQAVAEETDRVVATRGDTVIARTHHGLVMAGAGVDASNTDRGTVVLLPRRPDESARRLRAAVAELTGRNVGVLVSDTSGRAWRTGQTDIAIGAAGVRVVRDYVGRVDGYGNSLHVSVAAVVDELAGAADLVKGKLTGCPAAVVRGLATLVLPAGEHGPGAGVLVRPEADDLFGYGAREAVARAVRADPSGLRGFGSPCTAEELTAGLQAAVGGCVVTAAPDRVELRLPAGSDPALARRTGRLEARAAALAFAFGWVASEPGDHDDTVTFRPPASVD